MKTLMKSGITTDGSKLHADHKAGVDASGGVAMSKCMLSHILYFIAPLV
jgi:hypothetical protein